MVALCGYRGWHDWYLSANLGATTALDGHLLPGLDTKGVPRGLAGLMHPFHFNKLDEIEAIVAEHGEQLATIVMEPVRSTEPEPAFIKGIRALADRCSAALIFDEVTSGFRINSGGAHLAYGVDPDIAVFAKAIANVFPTAAIVGRAPGDGRSPRDLFQLDSLDRARRPGRRACHFAQASRAERRQAFDADRHPHPEGLDRSITGDRPATGASRESANRS
jgi:glutamate-1-semialdehyde aminotransferase